MSLASTPFASKARQLLNLMDNDDLQSIAHTASNNRINPTSRKESIEAILINTPDLSRLFSYRRVKSQVLYEYLVRQKVAVGAQCSKIGYANAVQEYWEKSVNKNKPTKDDSPTKITAYSAINSLQRKSQTTERYGQQELGIKSYTAPNISVQVNNVMINPTVQEGANLDFRCFTNTLQSASIQHQSSGRTIKSDEFTRHFCNWYYTMVNRLQPVCAHISGDILREDIFCSNCSVEVYIIGVTSTERSTTGPSACCTLLRDTFTEHRILFNPNVESGVQAHASNHGLVKLMVCGTLHQDNSLVGVFEQEFGLVRSPVDRAWKIVYTKLNLKHGVLSTPPTLPTCQVFEITM